jgi:predicted Zn-dependent protease
MSRTYAFSLSALSATILFAAGCGRSDRPTTASASAGGTTPTEPVISTSSPETTGAISTVTSPVTYDLAESAFDLGDYAKASQLFTTYTESNPENPWGYYMLGLSAWRTGEHDRAVTAFDKALQLDPDHRKSLFNSSRVLLEMGRPKDAVERIEKALTLEPMSNEGLRLLGRARYQLGKVDEAIEAYHHALVLDERDVWSMNNLGLIYIEQDRSSEALPPLARAVELRSNAPVFQNNLGVALERSGYPTAAAKAYEAAIGVDSTYHKASVGLARVSGGSQQPESEPVDLAALSRKFQGEIEEWRGAVVVSDSSAAPGDSTLASVEAVTDTLENCAHE